MEKVLLTGATGYLGGRLKDALLKEKVQLRCLARNPPAGDSSVEWIKGDLTDLSSLERACEGMDTVFHVAAYVKRWVRNPREFDEVNITGWENVARTAHRSGVKKILYTSSFMGLGPSADGPVNEGSRNHTQWRNDYERTKSQALFLTDKLVAEGLPIITLFPGVIYGPGAWTQGNLISQLLADFVNDKVPGLIGDGDKEWSYVFVDDVVTGHILAWKKGKPGDSYVLGGENVDLAGLFARAAEITGKAAPKRKLPYGLLAFVGRINELFAYLGAPVMLTRGEIEIFRMPWACDSSHAREKLGYAPRSLKDGMQETLDWIRQESKAS